VINKVILVGNLGRDPEVRFTTGGKPVAQLSVATTDVWMDQNNQKQERTEWHRVVAWGKLAEVCGQYLSKGRQVYVEGRLQTRSYEDKDGVKKYTTEIVANTVKFLSGGGGAGRGAGAGGDPGFPPPGQDETPPGEDIPF